MLAAGKVLTVNPYVLNLFLGIHKHYHFIQFLHTLYYIYWLIKGDKDLLILVILLLHCQYQSMDVDDLELQGARASATKVFN